MSENILKDSAMASMHGLFKAFPLLRTLNLSGNLLGSDGMVDLAEAIGTVDHFCCLILGQSSLHQRHNAIGNRGLHKLARNLQLTTISLCNTGLTAPCVKSLELLLQRGLVNLNVAHNDLKNEGISNLLPQCTNLARLDISYTGCIGDRIYLPLLRLLERTSTMCKLAISGNSLKGRAFSRKIAGAIGRSTLSMLYVRKCGISSMVQALTSISNLTIIDLSSNGIVGTSNSSPSEEADAIAALVKHPLRVLKLNGNPLGDAGIEPLARAISLECQLEVLQLNNIKLHTGGLCYLLACLATNVHLQTLSCENNFLTDGTHQHTLLSVSCTTSLDGDSSSDDIGRADDKLSTKPTAQSELDITQLLARCRLWHLNLARGNRLSNGVLSKVAALCAQNRHGLDERKYLHSTLIEKEELEQQYAIHREELQNVKQNLNKETSITGYDEQVLSMERNEMDQRVGVIQCEVEKEQERLRAKEIEVCDAEDRLLQAQELKDQVISRLADLRDAKKAMAAELRCENDAIREKLAALEL